MKLELETWLKSAEAYSRHSKIEKALDNRPKSILNRFFSNIKEAALDTNDFIRVENKQSMRGSKELSSLLIGHIDSEIQINE